MIDLDLMSLLVCPLDGGPLAGPHHDEAAGGGALSCTRCGRAWPVLDGIPSFLQLETDELQALKSQEIRARDTRYAAFRRPGPADDDRVLEADAIAAALGDLAGKAVLDAGCGAGGITRHMHGARHIVGLDFSRQGLVHFEPPPDAKVSLVHGDVCYLPFRSQAFDAAYSSQVLEHVPSLAQRTKFFAELARVLKPGGRMVLTVYNWDAGRKRSGIPKEGQHASGVYYCCYEREELRRDLGGLFRVRHVGGAEFLLPWTYRTVQRLGRHRVLLERALRRLEAPVPYAKLLVATCERAGDDAHPSGEPQPPDGGGGSYAGRGLFCDIA